MTIVACRECGHGVSTQALGCPNCGAPTATVAVPVERHAWWRVAIALAVLGIIAAALWLTPAEWLGSASRGPRAAADRPEPAAAPASAWVQATPVAAPAQATPVAAAVYATTAEQLVRDYGANAVAIQDRIGKAQVRVTGTVAEIDEDSAGHPLVRLAAGGGANGADMLLRDDQRGAAAQLFKGQSVAIQCDKIRRDRPAPSGTLQGLDCALVEVAAGAAPPAYLAITSADDKGTLLVVGPMPQGDCLSRAGAIGAQLQGNFARNSSISNHCLPTAREALPAAGCRLSSSMPALPDMPDAHLWRYDCGAPTETPARLVTARRVNRKPAHNKTTPADDERGAAVLPVAVPDVPALPSLHDGATASAAATAPAVIPVVTSFQYAAAAGGEAVAPPPVASFEAAAMSAHPGAAASAQDATALTPPASSGAPESGAAQAPSPTVTAPAPSAAAALPEDLAVVKARDPSAADHIASYCDNATAAAKDRASVAAGCRHEEEAAWKRLVVNNEFPTLDTAMRTKCNEPPFPDSYVAKESCARYEMRGQ